jgi:predicted Abi (CAAX) family protease
MSKAAQERNYQRYRRAAWTRPEYYPLDQQIDSTLYRPVATWIGRLILNERAKRDLEGGCTLEVHHADPAHANWVGQRVRLRFAGNAATQMRRWTVTRNVIFNDDAQKLVEDGLILAERVNRWRMVTPLESLAAGRPDDDMIVRLVEPLVIDERPSDGGAPILIIEAEPVQISGRYVGLVTFLAPATENGDHWRVRHFNPATRRFDGAEEIVAVPPPITDENNNLPSTSAGIEQSPLNAEGWYIYGAPDKEGVFVVQAWTPRALLRLQPERVVPGNEASWQYVRREAWANTPTRKGTIASVLCDPNARDEASAQANWQEGDRALILHVYAGIGGKQREPTARSGLYFGHFSFGVAEVIHEPLADELRFDITFYQIYTQNVDGLVAGALDWSRYIGDRQFGWGGLRPTCNILIKFDELNDLYLVDGRPYSVMDAIIRNLEQMAARYRIGDGRGATFVAAANNCAQDSSQAFYAAIVEVGELIETGQNVAEWAVANPEQAARLRRVQTIGHALQHKVVGGDARRADWRYGVENLGISENPIRNLLRGLGTWRTVLPRKASDTYAQVFLNAGATLWVLSTFQVGGYDPNIEPIPALTF